MLRESLWGPKGLPAPASELRHCLRPGRVDPADFLAEEQAFHSAITMGEPYEMVPGEWRPRRWRRAGREGQRAGGRPGPASGLAPSGDRPGPRPPDYGQSLAAPLRLTERRKKGGGGGGLRGKGVPVFLLLILLK